MATDEPAGSGLPEFEWMNNEHILDTPEELAADVPDIQETPQPVGLPGGGPDGADPTTLSEPDGEMTPGGFMMVEPKSPDEDPLPVQTTQIDPPEIVDPAPDPPQWEQQDMVEVSEETGEAPQARTGAWWVYETEPADLSPDEDSTSEAATDEGSLRTLPIALAILIVGSIGGGIGMAFLRNATVAIILVFVLIGAVVAVLYLGARNPRQR